MGVVGGCETNGRLISRPEYKEGYTDTLGFVRISLRNVSYTTIEWKMHVIRVNTDLHHVS